MMNPQENAYHAKVNMTAKLVWIPTLNVQVVMKPYSISEVKNVLERTLQ